MARACVTHGSGCVIGGWGRVGQGRTPSEALMRQGGLLAPRGCVRQPHNPARPPRMLLMLSVRLMGDVGLSPQQAGAIPPFSNLLRLFLGGEAMRSARFVCLFTILISMLVLAQSNRAPVVNQLNGLPIAQEPRPAMRQNLSRMPQGAPFHSLFAESIGAFL